MYAITRSYDGAKWTQENDLPMAEGAVVGMCIGLDGTDSLQARSIIG
ncbi:hypothetical protein [Paenibacillus periandrae]|nr:hypothetical protein [Paenibacillus periandrae]